MIDDYSRPQTQKDCGGDGVSSGAASESTRKHGQPTNKNRLFACSLKVLASSLSVISGLMLVIVDVLLILAVMKKANWTLINNSPAIPIPVFTFCALILGLGIVLVLLIWKLDVSKFAEPIRTLIAIIAILPIILSLIIYLASMISAYGLINLLLAATFIMLLISAIALVTLGFALPSGHDTDTFLKLLSALPVGITVLTASCAWLLQVLNAT